MAGTKRSKAKATSEINQPVRENYIESTGLSADPGETENNRLQRLLTIMELLGKLVEKNDSQTENGSYKTSLPASSENTREIVATIAGLLVESADLDVIKERLSLDKPEAVELLGILGEFLNTETRLTTTGSSNVVAESPKGELSGEPLESRHDRQNQGQGQGQQNSGQVHKLKVTLLDTDTKREDEFREKLKRKVENKPQLEFQFPDRHNPDDNLNLDSIREHAGEEWINILSSAFYHATREALSLNTFEKSEGSPWPTAPLNRGGASGQAQLVPPVIEDEPLMPVEEVDRWVEIMWKQREELSDLDADALDMLCHIWLEQAIKPEDSAVAEIDRFLEMRGLQKKKSGNNRRGGFTPEQRHEILRALSHIQSIWLKLGQIEIYEERDEKDRSTSKKKRQPVTKAFESRAFVVTDRMGQLKMDGYMDVERFIYQPGKLFAHFLFGPGRQTAILSAKAIQYDRYRQKWEKRLARYFSWQWRIQAARGDYTRPYRIITLLKAVGESVDERHPTSTRDRLEKALDRLQADKVLASWQYDRWEEKITEQRGWVEHWLQATVLLEPPESIRKTYSSLERGNQEVVRRARLQSLAVETDETLQLVENLKKKRLEIGISQSVCAEQLGIAQGVLSRLEKNKLKPSLQLQQRIRKWLKPTE